MALPVPDPWFRVLTFSWCLSTICDTKRRISGVWHDCVANRSRRSLSIIRKSSAIWGNDIKSWNYYKSNHLKNNCSREPTNSPVSADTNGFICLNDVCFGPEVCLRELITRFSLKIKFYRVLHNAFGLLCLWERTWKELSAQTETLVLMRRLSSYEIQFQPTKVDSTLWTRSRDFLCAEIHRPKRHAWVQLITWGARSEKPEEQRRTFLFPISFRHTLLEEIYTIY